MDYGSYEWTHWLTNRLLALKFHDSVSSASNDNQLDIAFNHSGAFFLSTINRGERILSER